VIDSGILTAGSFYSNPLVAAGSGGGAADDGETAGARRKRQFITINITSIPSAREPSTQGAEAESTGLTLK
jgi:hypothetical protein